LISRPIVSTAVWRFLLLALDFLARVISSQSIFNSQLKLGSRFLLKCATFSANGHQNGNQLERLWSRFQPASVSAPNSACMRHASALSDCYKAMVCNSMQWSLGTLAAVHSVLAD